MIMFVTLSHLVGVLWSGTIFFIILRRKGWFLMCASLIYYQITHCGEKAIRQGKNLLDFLIIFIHIMFHPLFLDDWVYEYIRYTVFMIGYEYMTCTFMSVYRNSFSSDVTHFLGPTVRPRIRRMRRRRLPPRPNPLCLPTNVAAYDDIPDSWTSGPAEGKQLDLLIALMPWYSASQTSR